MRSKKWLSKLLGSKLQASPSGRPVKTRKPPSRVRRTLETLEDRCCPSTFTVLNTLDDGSVGSLRWAVGQANAAAGADTINFGAAFSTAQTITLGGTQLELSDTAATTITGPAAGVTVSGGGLSRVFLVDAGASASFSNLTITGGNVVGTGGGVDNLGTATLTGCTVTSNNASGSTTGGGGIFNQGQATLISCTISGNSAYNGAGLLNESGTATLTNCTVSANSSYNHGALNNNFIVIGTLRLGNTIVAGNTTVVADGNTGPFTSLGTNLIGGNALLAPLGDYGGPTQTMPLLPGSPAIDAGTSGTGFPTTDQRGKGRVGATDIGAFESQGFTLTPVAGSTPQSAAIGAVFANPLAVTVKANQAVEPVNGGVVRFTNPGTGADAFWVLDPYSSNGFSSALSFSVTVASGQAAVGAVPHHAGGSYTVTASASGAAAASFALSNTGPSFAGLVVNTTSVSFFAGAGLMSLPLAVSLANIQTGADTITFDPTVFSTPQTITLNGHQLELSDTTGAATITGPVAGVMVSGGGLSGVFQVDPNVSGSFSNLTITGSAGSGMGNNFGTVTLANCTLSGNKGAGLFNYGGTATLTNCTISGNTGNGLTNQFYRGESGGFVFHGSASATLTNCTISGNTFNPQFHPDTGNGVFNYGSAATLTNCTISGNAGAGLDNRYYRGNAGFGYVAESATLTNCAISGNSGNVSYGYRGAFTTGGGLNNKGGTAVLTNCIISGNSATDGGGLYTHGGTTTLTNCTISSNSAYLGGGMMSGGTTTLTNCTVSGNTASNTGGLSLGGTATLTNCTVSGNRATYSNYGGIRNNGTATLTNCTVSGNSAARDVGGLLNIGTTNLANTIVAGNASGFGSPDVEGTISSQGHNLIGKTDGSSGWVASDLTGTSATPLNALLGPLGDNGGPTQTMALLSGSSAINAGSNAAIPAGVTTDQRGRPRIVNTTVDMGAFELNPTTVSSIVRTTPSGQLTNASSVIYTVSLAKAILGLTASDFHLTGTANVADSNIGTPATSNGGLTWTVSIGNLGSTNGTLILNLVSGFGLALDLTNLPFAGATYTLDHAGPTVAIVVADTALTVGETSLVTFTFSEAVTGFANADLAVANGTLSPVSSADGGTTWTATFTPTAAIVDATNVITLNLLGVQDLAGNAGAGATASNNYAIDTRPVTTVSSIVRTTPSGQFTSASSVTYTVSVANATLGLTASDFHLTGTANVADSNIGTPATSDGGSTWTVSIGVPGGAQGTLTLNLVSTTGMDHAPTNLPFTGATYTLDPRLFTTVSSIVRTTPSGQLTNASSVAYTVSFADATLGLTAGDFHLTGTANVADSNIGTAATSDSGLTWTVSIGNLSSANGTLILNLVSSTGLDHDPTNLPFAGATYTLDHTVPTVTIVVANTALLAGQSSLVTFTFSEAVTGFANADLAVANGTLSPVSSADGGTTWTATLTPTAGVVDATNVITLDKSGVQDQAGNAGAGATSSNNYTINTTSIGFMVTNSTDVVNGDTTSIAALVASPGADGISLREAVMAANNTPGADTIGFDSTLFSTAKTITLGGSQLELSDTTGAITIIAPAAGLTIDAGLLSRVFQVDVGVTAAISGLTITRGSASTGGGLSNSGVLTLSGCTFSTNRVNSGARDGGGLFNSGMLTLSGCTFSNNTAIGGSGGGLFNSGTVTLSGCTFSINSATGGSGGALFNSGTVTVSNCTFSGSSFTASANNGGGVYNAATGTATLTNCTITCNADSSLGGGQGGGVYNAGVATLTNCALLGSGSGTTADAGGGVFNSGTIVMTNCTVSKQATRVGGGMLNSGTATLTNCTIANNFAINFGGGIYNLGPLTVANTILATNTLGPSGNIASYNLINFGSTVLSNNLIDSPDPMLLPLGNYGGPTQTMALKLGSPAIDAGSNAALTLPSPTLLPFATATTGGSLAGNTTFYYVVSAINMQGETLASSESSQTTGSGSTNTVTIKWNAVPRATGYNIYGRTQGAELYLGTVNIGVTQFTDDGSLTPSGAVPNSNTTTLTTDQRGASRIVNSVVDIGATEHQSQFAIVTNPVNVTIYGGQTATFTAQTDAVPGLIAVLWQQSTNNGASWSNLTNGTSFAGVTTTTLSVIVSGIGTQFTGRQFRAVFTSSEDSTLTATTTAATLTVIPSTVAILTNPTSQSVFAGNTASFIAAATAVPDASAQWQVSIDSGVTFANIAGATSTTYSFTATAGDDGHQFRAVFTNTVRAAATATTTAATLTVTTGVATTVTVSWTDGTSTTYDGQQHSAIASWSSSDTVGGPLTVTYMGINSTNYASSATAPTNAGDYQASATFPGDATHAGSSGFANFTIDRASSMTITAGAGPFSYDGTTHSGGSGLATGAGGLSSSAVSLTYTGDQVNAGTYYVTAHFVGDANHTASDGAAVAIVINQASTTTTTLGAGPFTYDGSSHMAGTGTVIGSDGFTTSATLTYSANSNGTGVADFIDAGTYYETAHFAGDINHASSDGAAVAINISQASTTTTTMFGAGPFTYDGSSHMAGSGTVVGSDGFTTSATLTYSANSNGTGVADFIDAGTYYVTAHFGGDINHASSDGAAVAINISQASTTTTTLGAGPFTYDGSSHMAGSGTVIGSDGFTTSATLSFSANSNGTGVADFIDAGTYYVTAHFAGDSNHASSDGAAVAINISQASTTTTTLGAGPFAYDGSSHMAGSGTVVGSDGFTTSASLTYSANGDGTGVADFIDAGTYYVTAHFGGDSNHASSDGSPVAIVINQASTITTTLGAGPFTYNSSSHMAGSGTVIGSDGFTTSATLSYSANSNGTGAADFIDAGTYYVTAHFGGDSNHASSDGAPVAIVINQASTITTTLGAGPFTYNGSSHMAGSGTVIGSDGFTTSATLSYSANSNGTGVADFIDAGTYYVTAHFGGDSNHASSDGAAVAINISQASTTTTTLGAGPFTYNGSSHMAGSGTVIGSDGFTTGASLTFSANSNGTGVADFIDAGTYYVTAHFGGDSNHTASNGSPVAIVINQARASITVTAFNVTFNGQAHTATGAATGVAGVHLNAGLTLSSTTHTNAGTYNGDAWSFHDASGNYQDDSGTVDDSIARATASITVTGYSVTFDGNAHTATRTATGVGGVDLSGNLTLGGTTHTSAGTYNGDVWSFAGGMNYFDANGTVNDSIAQAPSTTTVTFVAGPYVWTGAALTPALVTVTGRGGLSLTPTATYTNNINVGLATASYSYAGDANHLPSSDSKNFTIVPALPVVISPTATSITSSLATLGGNVTSNAGATLLKRGILYAPTSTNSSPTLHGNGVIEVDATSTATGVLTQDLTGLNPNTRYSFVAFASNIQGTGYSPTGTFATTILGPLSVITGPGSGRPGQVLTYVLDGYDPSPGMQLRGFVFRIKWDDGKTDTVTAVNDTTLNHTYASAGAYTIQITATDGRGFTLPTGTCTVVISSATTPNASLAGGGVGAKQTPAAGISMLVAATNGTSSKITPANTTASASLVGPSAVSSTLTKTPAASTSVTPAQSGALDAVLAEWVANHKADSNSLDLLAAGSAGYDLSVGDGLFGG